MVNSGDLGRPPCARTPSHSSSLTLEASPVPAEPSPVDLPGGRSRWLWVTLLALCALGLAVATKLAFVHLHAHLDPSAKSFCAISDRINCDTVARSKYSVFLQVPIAAWGVYGYLVMAGVGIWGVRARREEPSAAAFALLAAFSVAVSAVLGAISALCILALCILCLSIYVINLALLVNASLLVRRAGFGRSFAAAWHYVRNHWGNAGAVAAMLALITIGLVTGYPRYWENSAQAGTKRPHLGTAPTPGADGGPREMASGVTEDGHPWIGAQRPSVTVEEFSDYQCPFCNQAHEGMRALLSTLPGLRLVHRHFPLDQACNPIIDKPFHPYACAYSALAACAGEQNRFWAANDYLFKHGHDPEPVAPPSFAGALGLDGAKLAICLEKRAWAMVRPDVEEGVRLKITGTPTFQINGQLYLGQIPPDVLAPAAAPASSR
jgi:protein-disulfide isomerase/uncharacterized membrane protein